jgi:hypothetical protein
MAIFYSISLACFIELCSGHFVRNGIYLKILAFFKIYKKIAYNSTWFDLFMAKVSSWVELFIEIKLKLS